MKNALRFLIAAMMSCLANAAPCLVTTTIDFLDYVFYDRIGSAEYYDLKCYEQRIRELAEGGIRQINLRTNCMGLALYPSKVLRLYGEDGRYHYSEPGGSKRLAETLKRYDPVAETIRIGHKYGLAVWCWDNLCDEIGLSQIQDAEIPAEFRELNRRRGGYPLADDFFLQHPECWARRKGVADETAADDLLRIQESPVVRLRLTSTVTNRPPVNFGKADLAIYTSKDNDSWQLYEKDFNFQAGRMPDGRNYLEFSELDISVPFIKIVPTKAFPDSHPYSFVVKGLHYGEIYNQQGERLDGTWGCRVPGAGANLPEQSVKLNEEYVEHSSLDLEQVPEMAFDYRFRQLGCQVGKSSANDIFIGMIEFCHPLARERKVTRFAELAAYPFDGYILTMNCHSSRSEPDSYSFNPAVRERILARTGKDIYRESVPLQMLLDERRDGLSEYIEECKKTIGDRPLYLEGWGPGYGKGGMYQRENFGSIYPDYERLIRHDAIDGVVMWHDFSAFFEPKVLGGKKIVLGYYIGLVEVKSLVDKVQFLLGNPHLAMVDFYESLLFTQHPRWLQELQSIHR